MPKLSQQPLIHSITLTFIFSTPPYLFIPHSPSPLILHMLCKQFISITSTLLCLCTFKTHTSHPYKSRFIKPFKQPNLCIFTHRSPLPQTYECTYCLRCLSYPMTHFLVHSSMTQIIYPKSQDMVQEF